MERRKELPGPSEVQAPAHGSECGSVAAEITHGVLCSSGGAGLGTSHLTPLDELELEFPLAWHLN